MNVEGSQAEFRSNWIDRTETTYSHFTRGEPSNQIQLAFRQHWQTWNRMFPELSTPSKVLEVGSGRGTLSMYFAQNGWETTILDVVPEVLDHAEAQFRVNGLNVTTVAGDCLAMPLPEETFDVVFSVGLLEHFSDAEQVLREQVRVLAPGGLLIAYVVPEPGPNCVQVHYEWVNDLLRSLNPAAVNATGQTEKSAVYRSSFRSPYYLDLLSRLGCSNLGSSGTYPVPMISWSTEFPFTLLPEPAENVLTDHFLQMLADREKEGIENPWLCDEEVGQAFLVWGRK